MGFRFLLRTALLRTVCQLFIGALGAVIVSSTNAAPLFGGVVVGTSTNTDCSTPLAVGAGCFYSATPEIGTLIHGQEGGASAYADYRMGKMGTFVAGGAVFGAVAGAAIWDTLTFPNALPGDMATVTMSGNIAGENGGITNLAAGSLLIPYATDTVQNQWLNCYNIQIALAAGLGVPDIAAYCAFKIPGILNGFPNNAAVTVWDLSSEFPIDNTDTYFFLAELSGNVDPGTSGFITDPITLDLPPGVTFTSASGLFQPTVPEPATLALIGLGLAGLGFSRRKR